MKKAIGLLLFGSLFLVDTPAEASGSVARPTQLQDRQLQGRQRQVDPLYDQGKAVFKGRVRDYGKLMFCVVDPESGELAKLKRKTVKPFRDADATNFAASLYNCEMPEQQIAGLLTRNDLVAVVYYLNKRFKLMLA
ncbi:MAG: hypothetical protein AAGI67_19770 [Pseudomonadota bacterium]